jgi:hypothetical protein
VTLGAVGGLGPHHLGGLNLDALPPELLDRPVEELDEFFCQEHLGVWVQSRRGLTNSALHWEWAELAMTNTRLCVVAPRDHAKALALDTPVLRPDGRRTPIGEIAPGDMVVARDGSATRVTAESEVFTDHDCYRLVLDDGQEFVADAGHQWVTYYAWRGEQTVTTRDIAADTRLAARRGQRHVIDCAAWDSPDTELEIDPYILGCWLGDGTSTRAEITSADSEILAAFELAGYQPTYRYQRGEAQTVGHLGLWRELRLLGVLSNKHVPDSYLRAGAKQRLAMLQGLMDTDGSIDTRGQALFRSTTKALADAVAELAWGLGWKPKRYQTRAKLDGVDHGPCWGVSFYPDTVPAFRLAHKADRQCILPEGRRSKAGGRSVRACEQTLTVPVKCITTEAGTFQIGEGVVTHNSETFTVGQLAWRIIYNPGVQCLAFTSEAELAKDLKSRVDAAVALDRPELLEQATLSNANQTKFGNAASIMVRTTGQKVRGLHPDIIVGDDVLEEANTLTHYQRKKIERWWFGTVEGMAHPGTWRVVGRHRVWMPPTRIHLVGTPFHAADLLMNMRTNPVYRFRRYVAEYDPADLVPGTLAVEAA